MRIAEIKHLEPSIGGPRVLIVTDDKRGIEATQMYTFSNGWTLMLMENYSIDGQNMILVNRDREISLSNGKQEFTLKPAQRLQPKPCQWCREKNPRVESSVSAGIYIHTDTPMGRQVCTEPPEASRA